MPDNIWEDFMEIVGPYSMMFIKKLVTVECISQKIAMALVVIIL